MMTCFQELLGPRWAVRIALSPFMGKFPEAREERKFVVSVVSTKDPYHWSATVCVRPDFHGCCLDGLMFKENGKSYHFNRMVPPPLQRLVRFMFV